MSTYNQQLKSTLFDISTQDKQRTRNLEEQFSVKMTSLEYDFFKDQKGSQIAYCTFACRQKMGENHTNETERPTILRENEEK